MEESFNNHSNQSEGFYNQIVVMYGGHPLVQNLEVAWPNNLDHTIGIDIVVSGNDKAKIPNTCKLLYAFETIWH